MAPREYDDGVSREGDRVAALRAHVRVVTAEVGRDGTFEIPQEVRSWPETAKLSELSESYDGELPVVPALARQKRMVDALATA